MDLIIGVIKETWILFLQMSFYLVLGFLVAGFIHILLKPQLVFRHLGEKGIPSILKAVLFGVPLPLCSCGVLPPAATLLKSGATKGSVIAFLISTPTTGIDSIFATYGLLGGIFTLFRIVISIIMGFIAGLFTDIFSKQEQQFDQDNLSKISCSETTVAGVFRYAFIELYGSIAKWIFWGVLVGGIITYLIPDEFVSGITVNRYLTYLLMLGVGIPLYVCAISSIPIAASLIFKGLSPGAGLIFLIAGPATNTVTMFFVAKTLGKKGFIIYLSTVITGAILSGFLLDTMVINYNINISEVFHRHRDFSLLSYLSTFLLIGISINSIIVNVKRRIIPGKSKNCFIFNIPNISCVNCAKKIINNLGSLDGVKNVEVDVKKKKVRVCSEFDNKTKIKEKLDSIGYPVSE